MSSFPLMAIKQTDLLIHNVHYDLLRLNCTEGLTQGC